MGQEGVATSSRRYIQSFEVIEQVILLLMMFGNYMRDISPIVGQGPAEQERRGEFCSYNRLETWGSHHNGWLGGRKHGLDRGIQTCARALSKQVPVHGKGHCTRITTW